MIYTMFLHIYKLKSTTNGRKNTEQCNAVYLTLNSVIRLAFGSVIVLDSVPVLLQSTSVSYFCR